MEVLNVMESGVVLQGVGVHVTQKKIALSLPLLDEVAHPTGILDQLGRSADNSGHEGGAADMQSIRGACCITAKR
jgi:hypothetical protein